VIVSEQRMRMKLFCHQRGHTNQFIGSGVREQVGGMGLLGAIVNTSLRPRVY